MKPFQVQPTTVHHRILSATPQASAAPRRGPGWPGTLLQAVSAGAGVCCGSLQVWPKVWTHAQPPR